MTDLAPGAFKYPEVAAAPPTPVSASLVRESRISWDNASLHLSATESLPAHKKTLPLSWSAAGTRIPQQVFGSSEPSRMIRTIGQQINVGEFLHFVLHSEKSYYNLRSHMGTVNSF